MIKTTLKFATQAKLAKPPGNKKTLNEAQMVTNKNQSELPERHYGNM